MKVILVFLFFGIGYAHAESCLEQAKNKFTQDVTADPILGLKQEVMVRSCEVNYAKAILLTDNFLTLCPGIQTPYRQRCLRDWISKYQMSVAAEPELILSMIPLASAEDQKIPHVHNQVLLTQLID